MRETIVTGVDIGGSHISASLVDIEQRRVLKETASRNEVDSSAGITEIIDSWATVIDNCFTGEPPANRLIGIAMPGPVDYDTGMCYIRGQNKYESLYGQNLKTLLAQKLNVPAENIQMINDAAGFLAGEMFTGSARDHQHVMGLTLGTGLGSAWTDNGEVMDADLWHHPFLKGKAEDYLSAPWLLAETKSVTGISFPNVKSLAEKTTGNGKLEKIFSEFGMHLGMFLSIFLRKKEIEIIILGGNISKASCLFVPALETSLAKEGFSQVLIRPATIGEDAALIGAASRWDTVAKSR